MKIEFLKNTGDDLYSNVLRIYDFDKTETIALRNSIETIVLKKDLTLDFNSLNYIESFDFGFTMKCFEQNFGVSQI